MTRLDTASRTSRLVVVGAEAGAGKTSLVASWAHQAGPRTGVVWRDLGHADHVDEVLDDLAGELADPLVGDRGLRAVDQRRQGPAPVGSIPLDRSIVVLDDFPVEPENAVAVALDRLVHRIGDRACVVLVCSASPALDLQRLGVGPECRDLTSRELAMNNAEIAAVLSREGVDPTPTVVDGLRERTSGWAWGVRRGASLLARSASIVEAFAEIDLALADYLQHSILRDLSVPSTEMLIATSVVAEVSPDLASAILGADRGLPGDISAQARGFVRLRADGSFTVHPLLRRHLVNRLRRHPAAARDAGRRAAQHTVETGDLDGAIAIALEQSDWTWAAQTLVESLHIPRLLVMGSDPLLDGEHVIDSVGAAQPMLTAAAALGRAWPDLAVRVVSDASVDQDRTDAGSSAAQLSESLVRMALARWQGEPDTGLRQLRAAMALLPRLSLTQRVTTPELAPLLQSHAAAFEVMNGAPDRARVALERGARAFRPKQGPTSAAATIAAAACLGQLAWQEALAGELASSSRHAAAVLTARPADSNEVGVVHAQLATIWCQVSRDELDQAVQRFQSVDNRRSMPADGAFLPELAMATGLVAARLGAAVGHGGVGYELHQVCTSLPCAREYEHQLNLIRAETELNAGLPTAALHLLADATPLGAEVHALRARAWIQLGDLASVGASLRVRPVEAMALLPRLQLDLIEAWLARAHDDRVRQRSLIDRVLRAAGREQLRAPLAWAKSWLLDVIGSDPGLLQRHGTFLASIRTVGLGLPDSTHRPSTVAAPVSDLTQREIDILQRLGALSTNEEIAADLFLSPNTVKTHLKSLYRKLEVTRRSDAFRRGRALGLC
ncbi:MAG TPA: LuxR C-terminal-related transcriptional regulator [Microlunatus sp.]